MEIKNNEVLTVCCSCRSVKDQYGNYNANIVITPNLHEYSRTQNISHGICGSCLEKHYGITPLDSQVHKAEKIAHEEAVR